VLTLDGPGNSTQHAKFGWAGAVKSMLLFPDELARNHECPDRSGDYATRRH